MVDTYTHAGKPIAGCSLSEQFWILAGPHLHADAKQHGVSTPNEVHADSLPNTSPDVYQAPSLGSEAYDRISCGGIGKSAE